MQSRIKKVVGLSVGAAAVAATIGTSTSAFADPLHPTAVNIAGVGSATTQYVMDQIALNYNASAGHVGTLGSWDAIPAGSSIVVKPSKAGCKTAITRPNGSGAGITALLADSAGCIDFARSSSAKKTDGSQSSLAFFQYGKDNLSWSRHGTSVVPAGASLTIAQLKAIYQCLPTARTWNQVIPGAAAKTIFPYLPQSGSGTRNQWLLNIGGGTAVTPGACVSTGKTPNTIEENNGKEVIADATGHIDQIIFPYSSADWVAQQNQALGQPDNRAGVTLVNTFVTEGATKYTPLKLAAGQTARYVSNTTFDPKLIRHVFNVVKLVNGAVPANLLNVFGPNGYICHSQGSTITKFGFIPEAAGKCGLRS